MHEGDGHFGEEDRDVEKMKGLVMTTPSRLHLGIIDMRGDLGRIYCSVGVAIDFPNVVVRARPAKELIVRGQNATETARYAKSFLRGLGIDRGAEILVDKSIPRHVGLGSGTQLALAIGHSLSKLFDVDIPIEEISLMLGRGAVSGIGTYAFKMGGFIVDGGHKLDEREAIPPLLLRLEFPSHWFFVVGIPKIGHGLSGREERRAFRRPPLMSKETSGEIARTVLVQMIPALIEEDGMSFGKALTDLDLRVGEYWAQVQGGRYCDDVVEKGVEFLIERGAFGAGQSSWGPSFYGFVEGYRKAIELREALHHFLAKGDGGEVFHARASNCGAVWKEE